MAKYTYPAIFTPEDDGLYSVYFPDIKGCYTSGENLADAIYMAQDVLAYALFDLEREGLAIPSSSDLLGVKHEPNEFVNYIACDTLKYRKLHNNRAVKKTLTIPEWLNETATEMGINFSQVLQEALLQRVNMG